MYILALFSFLLGVPCFLRARKLRMEADTALPQGEYRDAWKSRRMIAARWSHTFAFLTALAAFLLGLAL